LVYIKRVDLRGFKTFGKKATVHLDRGLTIITGPNGSGKSNILDSVKFALGELSPKELRGETIGDLVHKGAQAASTRSAWVAVQFDNHDRRIPIDSEAVTISREFRRGGEGIYRLNGRRISRKQLTDILSSADIQVSGYNIVPQHAITRLAEVTTEERRKIIEDMIGIGVYDVKKASAQAELQKADVNLQVASAKIEEVRLRVESLERERNNYLKFLQIRKELNESQAKSVSYKIQKSREQVNEMNQEILQNQQQLQELKSKRDQLMRERTQIEAEKRQYEDSVAVKESTRLLDAQRAIGDLNATIARLRAHRDATQANTTSLQQQKAELERNSRDLDGKILSSKNELQKLELDRERLLKTLASKQLSVDNSLRALTELRERTGERSKEAEELENRINRLSHRIMSFNSQIKASTTKTEILSGHLQTLTARKEEYVAVLHQVSKRLEDLKAAKSDEENRALRADQKITEYTKVKEQRAKEIENANHVAKKASLSLTEIDTRTNMARDFASDDKALRLIEEMAESGTVSGVYGRLGDLIRVRNSDLKAAEAAAAGWLKAIVVKDLETAISCIEVLKRTKIGRVKLIPLKGLAKPQRKQTPANLQDIIGPMGEQLEFKPQFQPAVDYVFGDTVLARNQKSAFLASLQGVRAVAPSGDLYEPGGAMETGYFRQPLDMSKLLLHARTVDQLRNTLSSLEKLTYKAREEIARIDQEILEQTKIKAQSLNLMHLTEKEVAAVTESLERAHKTVDETTTRSEQLTREIATEQTILAACVSRKHMLEQPVSEFEQGRDAIRIQSQSSAILALENEYSKLTIEANELLRQKIETEGRIQSLRSTINAIEPTAEQIRNQITSIDGQQQNFDSQLMQINTDLPQYEHELELTNQSREELTEELAAMKKKRDEYDEHLRGLEKQITAILEELDLLNSRLADLTASSKQMQMQIGFHLNELKELACAEVTEVSDEEIQKVEKMIPVLKKELVSIGGVNELAASQYDEVKGNYKQLASRIYDLENEKLSIVKFMNELDKQKLEAFMKAFNQVSDSFNEIFSTVTSGVGRLFLEKPDNPFEAGADIKLQFPGKTEMSIGSASGGEKSVGTVCFILALQAIHPMPFYMMDEIDAHLDVVNSQKLAELLRAKSKGSQFIVVSLKDVTIARADAVYGVFIQEGVSQIVSLPMQEVRIVGRNN
jgi:chromosome segregation protein